MAQKLTREQLLKIVKDIRIYDEYPDGDRIIDALLEYIKFKTSCSKISDLLNIDELSDEKVVDAALQSKPIQL